MKTRHKLIFIILLLFAFLSDSYAQRFYYFPDGESGYLNLKIIDNDTNNVKDSLPAIFSSVHWNRKSGDDFVIAELGFNASFVLDTALTIRALSTGYACLSINAVSEHWMLMETLSLNLNMITFFILITGW